jgi:hypothetical protein
VGRVGYLLLAGGIRVVRHYVLVTLSSRRSGIMTAEMRAVWATMRSARGLPCGREGRQRTTEHTKESFPPMPAMILSAPLLPGKEEQWRRFMQEVIEERLSDYEQLRRRLRIRNESVWLARANAGVMVIAHLEADAPEWVASALTNSTDPFDLWFKERLLEFHGRALVRVPRRTLAKLIFAYPDSYGTRPLASESGPS